MRRYYTPDVTGGHISGSANEGAHARPAEINADEVFLGMGYLRGMHSGCGLSF